MPLASPPLTTPLLTGSSWQEAERQRTHSERFGMQTPITDLGLLTSPWAQWFNAMWALLISLSGGGGASNLSYVEDVNLTADGNLTSPATPNAGDRLTAYVTQDSVGGWNITIGSGFKLVTANDLDKRPNRVTVLNFCGRSDSNWWLDSPPFSRTSS